MKPSLCLAVFALLVAPAHAQTNNAYQWKATIKVVDESGAPFFGAHATIGYYINSIATGNDGITDINGTFTVTHTALSELADISFEAKKDGYYSIWQEVNLQPPFEFGKWNPVKTLVLKRIGRPIAMYAKSITSLRLPELNKAIGYDLMIGDWVGPNGKGVNTDLFFTEKHTGPNSGYIISASFPKAGDGIREFIVPETEKGSGLRSSHEAPADGYQSELSQTEMTNPNRNFYFRVRTKLDENGNVVSARYGKIYGDLAQFTYYLNPTPNDRNIEFDPKQNLLPVNFGDLKVNAP
jgi:hypothetical protein